MPIMTGAEAFVASVVREGVEVIFGLPGVQIMALLDAVYHCPRLRWISVRHEQTAGFMALGYARTTGKIGVAAVVPGPGALNATAAIGTAYATSTPVLLLSGQVESFNLGKQRGALHEVVDQLDVFKPITKWCHRVLRVEDVPGAVQQAMYHLRSGRVRPVELEIPSDIVDSSGEVTLLKSKPIPVIPPEPAPIRAAAELLASARRPIILAGGGATAADASPELTAVAEHLRAPVITTPEGKGAIREDHPLALGTFYYRIGPAKYVFPRGDVILVVGSRLYFRAPLPGDFRPDRKLIQIDIDASEIGRNQSVQVGIVADARLALKSLLEELPEKSQSTWQPSELEEIRKTIVAAVEAEAPLQLSILRTIRRELTEESILIPGVTNVAYWGHLAYPVLRPRTYFTTSYFATLGFAFPAALGAKVGNPDKPVVTLCGDGGFMYALPDLATAVQEKLNVVTLVFADGAFGASLDDQQTRFGGRVIGTRFHNPDFAQAAQSFGAIGIKLSHPAELAEALPSALKAERPAVIEIPIPTLSTPFGMPRP